MAGDLALSPHKAGKWPQEGPHAQKDLERYSAELSLENTRMNGSP